MLGIDRLTYEQLILFSLLLILTSNAVDARPIESPQGNLSSIVSISYDGTSVDRIRIESMIESSSMNNCTNSSRTMNQCQSSRIYDIVFLRNDEIIHQIQIEILSIQIKDRISNETNRTVLIRFVNCTNLFNVLTVHFDCDLTRSTNVCQLKCENIRNDIKIQLLFCEHQSLNSTRVSLVENLLLHWDMFDNETDKDIQNDIQSEPMFWFVGVAVLFVLLTLGVYNWKGKEFKAYLKTKKRQSDFELSIDSTASTTTTTTTISNPSYHYQIKEMKPKPLSFYENLRIENRRVIRHEFQDLENLSPVYSPMKTRSNYLDFDRDEKLFARGPWSRTAVHLKGDAQANDYINANEIKGFHRQNEFIACQHPMENTSEDFWQMILQYETTAIVMLNRFDENNDSREFSIKYAQCYFPMEINKTYEWTTIRVKTIKIEHQLNNQLEIRHLIVEKGLKKHCVTHYCYLNWPETPSITAVTLIDLIEIIRSENENISSPLVVHCRFGTGRTGTFIAMNILIDLINENENVLTFKLDLMGVVRQLRFDRNKLVEREDEYLLLYRSVSEYLQRKSRSETRPISSLSYRSDLNQVFINDPRLSPDLSIRNETQTPKDEEILSVRF